MTTPTPVWDMARIEDGEVSGSMLHARAAIVLMPRPALSGVGSRAAQSSPLELPGRTLGHAAHPDASLTVALSDRFEVCSCSGCVTVSVAGRTTDMWTVVRSSTVMAVLAMC